MPKPFVPLTLAQFREMLGRFPFTRRVDRVHMHHTWRPNRSQYKGLASIEAMHEFHVRERGFSDIAQHITIAPDGTIWTGRNWDKAPASATGHNGNSFAGPFMFEMIGDFDTGMDPFDDPQRATTLQVIAAVQQRFGLAPEALRFHRQMSSKTCPGSGIDFDEIVQAVREIHASAERAPAASGGPFAATFRDDRLTGTERSAIQLAIDTLLEDTSPPETTSAAEPPESDEEVLFTGTGRITTAAARGVAVTAADLVALRPHVINLSAGMLTKDGEFFTLPEDVERIFGEDMERAFANPASAGMPPRAADEPFRIMLWAHGGLISEQDGLAIARKHLDFWKKNGVYPIYFVWETGLMQTLGQLLRNIVPGSRAARNFFSDNIGDPLLERLARGLGGEKIWSGMKRNAELASTPAGGAATTARELRKFCDRHGEVVEIHAAGHSAGSIFHAHFLPVAFDAGIPAVAQLHLLAPAIRVDTFKTQLLPLIGTKVGHLALFTMVREQELDDHCADVYRKSLLYLIHFSLEKEKEAEILGLEESLRRDRDVTAMLGLAGRPSAGGEVVLSPSAASDGQHATRSTTHGGFDDDAATMNSIALRVLGLQAKSGLKMPYSEAGTRGVADDPWSAPELDELRRSFASAVLPAEPGTFAGAVVAPGASGGEWATPGRLTAAAPSGRGARRALCVGIDRYPVKPLAGCVADARLWARTLQGVGFDCDLLLDGEATYTNIANRLERLVRTARPGDVIVWQYSGHGTQVPDVNGDELSGDSPGQDEAICPIDMGTGRMFTDDEIAGLIQQLQPGVAFTMLMDCCHSGTLNRFGLGEPPGATGGADERSRFLPLSDDLRQAYVEFARSQLGAKGLTPSRTRAAIQQTNEVLFTACLSTEVAWESNGQGEFTVRATKLLAERGGVPTNEEFIDAIIGAFGAGRRQTPTLACAAALRTRRMFEPFGSVPARPVPDADAKLVPEPARDTSRFGRIADALEGAARELRQV